MNNKIDKKNLVYFTAWSIIFIISILIMLITKGDVWDYIVFSKGNDAYMDFFNHIGYVNQPSETYYVNYNACFPAFAYIMYYIFNIMLPEGAVKCFDPASVSPYAQLLYIGYVAILVAFFVGIVLTILKSSSGEKYAFALVITFILSNIFIFDIVERGNAVFVVLVVLLVSIHFSESESKIKQEIALICIAIAAGFKIYPAIFGLKYLKKREWGKVFRLIVYGLIVMLCPYAVFGGIKGLVQNIKNLTLVQDYASGSIRGINQLVKGIMNWLNIEQMDNNEIVCTIAISLTFCVLIIVYFLLDKTWKELFILAAMMIIIPKWSGTYTTCYMMIPLIYYVKDYEITGKVNYIISICFAVIFSFNFIGYDINIYGNVLSESLRYIMLYIILICIIAYMIYPKMRKCLKNISNYFTY